MQASLTLLSVLSAVLSAPYLTLALSSSYTEQKRHLRQPYRDGLLQKRASIYLNEDTERES